jgi:Tfp pilus assembly protein PilV
MRRSTYRKNRPAGMVIQEAMVGILIIGVVLAGIAQMLTLAAAQRRTGTQRAAAALEAGNLMEDLMTRPWQELTAEGPAGPPVSEWCLHHVPDARLDVDVTQEEAASAARIDIRIDWPDGSGRYGRPVQLTAWRYSNQESDQ